MDYVLQTREVSKDFSGKVAVDHVSIKVSRGDIYGFIGENGAGKTTLMRMVCGMAAPTGGSITLFGGANLVSQRHKVGCTIENPALYPAMSAMENMEAQRLLLGIKEKGVAAKLLDMAGISGSGKKKARDFSLGMKQRLMIALSLLGDPEFLVLDEPTNGLDPVGIKEVRDFIHNLNQDRGITVLVSSHILGDLEKIATRYGVISNGKMVDEFQANELSGRCGKNLLIHADDLRKTEDIVSRMFPDAQIERTPELTLRVKSHVEDAGRMNTAFIGAGITVSALIPEGDKLEDYFLRLMGGYKHA
ncbi:ATP-binding cassette domain-containing protein [Lachnospiraceae bacterium ZAX-1]